MKLWGGIGALILFLVIWPLVYPEQFFIHISIFFFLSLIGTVSLNLMMRTGLLSFAHAGFMGIGAYTSTLLMMKMHFPFILAFCMAGVVPGLVALGVGPIVLRLKGVYFVLISFLLGEVIRLVFVNWGSVFGGSGGIFNIPAASIGFAGHSISFVSKTSVYYLAMVVAIMACLICISLTNSEFGRALNTINENDTLAECIGVNTFKYKLIAFSLGAFLVGMAGSIFAHYVRYIAPIDFTWRLGLDFIAYNVVGGIFSALGPILGTIILMPLPEFLRGAVEYQWILYSIIIILVIRFVPDGLASLPRKIRRTKSFVETAIN